VYPLERPGPPGCPKQGAYSDITRSSQACQPTGIYSTRRTKAFPYRLPLSGYAGLAASEILAHNGTMGRMHQLTCSRWSPTSCL
jgi:hypothetical protein